MYKGFYEDRFKKIVHIWDDVHGHVKVPKKEFDYAYVKDPDGDLKTITGEKVRKQYRQGKTWNKNNTYEADIPTETRVLIDVYGNSDEPSKNHVDFYFDIETEILQGFPDFNNPINKITSIAYYHRYTNADFEDGGTYCVLILDEEGKVPSSKKGNTEIVSFTSEEDLLCDFIDRFASIHPTVVTGWNIDNFDFPYLIRRCFKVVGPEKLCSLSPIGIVEINEVNTDPSLKRAQWIATKNLNDARNRGLEDWELEQYINDKKDADHAIRKFSTLDRYQIPETPYEKMYVKIAGVSIIDYISLYKNFTYSAKPSYRLDAIGKDEVDLGKIEYEGTLDKLFKEDINKFIDYNLNDVEIVKRLEDKLKFIELSKGICHTGHVSYESIFYSSAFIEGAILTYTKSLGVVTKNKPKKDNEQDGGGNFVGAYVKSPVPGKYKWIYDLDLTSLYPSIIMSINISPETKMGRVQNWEMEDYVGREIDYNLTYKTEDGKVKDYPSDDFYSLIKERNYCISGNGTVYSMSKKGLIPDILENWFSERVRMKGEMKKYGDLMNSATGDKREEYKKLFQSYKRKQHIQKILLNSVYGVLGLPGFRFFDLDNASAVTVTGQQVIKNTSEFVNVLYNKKLNTTDKDYCIYIDTDSNFFSSEPWIHGEYPNEEYTDEFMTEKTFEVASIIQDSINRFYDLYSKRFYNIDSHKLEIKQEMIAKSGVWFAKKRYAQWIINEGGMPVDEMDVKGLEVVRSDFPPVLKSFMSEILRDILEDKDKTYVTNKIIEFKDNLRNVDISQIAKPTGVNGIKKYTEAKGTSKSLTKYRNGTPVHIKSAMFYNDFLRIRKLTRKFEGIRDADKIKWVYMKSNPYNFPIMAFKGYDDPAEIMDFIKQYADYEKIFDKSLKGKMEDFYEALGWGKIPNNNAIFDFFEF